MADNLPWHGVSRDGGSVLGSHKRTQGCEQMADDEKRSLREEEIKECLRQVNQQTAKRGHMLLRTGCEIAIFGPHAFRKLQQAGMRSGCPSQKDRMRDSIANLPLANCKEATSF